MRYLLLTILFSATTVLLKAQVEVELTIENQSVTGTDFFFDIFLTRTATNPGSGDLYLGNADFVLTFNAGNFTNPMLSSEDPLNNLAGLCSFTSTNGNTTQTRELYFGNTSTVNPISGNKLIINLNGPTPSSQGVFDGRVAKINNAPSTHRLGRFKISGISNPNGTSDLQWVTSGGGVLTKVFSLANTTPWASTQAAVIATNPASILLPLELLHFSATQDRNSILLEWTSSNERNFSSYELERSTDGKIFTPIASIIGLNSLENETTYNFRDITAPSGILCYYRLKLNDLDGSFSFSPVRSAKLEADWESPLLVPNPSGGNVAVFFKSPLEGPISMSVFDAQGKLFRQQNMAVDEGANSMLIESSDLPQGVYFISLESEGVVRWRERGVRF